jgi:WD40 repeat protein
VKFLSPETFTGIYLDDAVSGARCAELLAGLDRRGFAATGERYPRGYRDNDRLVFDDPALAASLYAELADRLPHELDLDGVRWQLLGLNPRFRACRYRNGQSFCIHRDGPHVPSDDLRSQLTVQLYLDDAPDRVGGRTRFYADPQGRELWAAITPKRGAAIVFDHRAWHDGEAVTAGKKHVLRTDAMYRRLDAAAVDRDTIGRHRGYAWRVIACRDGSLMSSGRDGTVRRWGRAPRTVDLGAGSVTVLVEDARGRIWCGTRSGAAFVIDGDGVTRVADDVGAVLGGCADGERVVLATARGALLAFDAPRAPVWSARAHIGWAWAVALAGESLASCGEDGRIAITDPAGRTRTLAELGAPLRVIAAAPGGLLVGDTRGWLHRVSGHGEPLATLRAHDAAITGLALAPDGTTVTASEDGHVKRWRDQALVASARAADFVTSVALDARGEVIYAGYDGKIRRAAV